MLCKNPYVAGEGQAYGCGQCLPCRLNRRRIWAHRIMLEASMYEANSFVTLTYSPENLPDGGSLVPAHYQRWLKRLRKRLSPQTFRYFLVGEYGEGTERPHYHAALFGYPSCGQSPDCSARKNKCPVCSLIRDTWGYGHVQVGTLTDASSQYIAGYVTKKLTDPKDPRLKGRHPEFARMSLRPGLGADVMHDLASVNLQYEIVEKTGDVPFALSHGRKSMPLGRYLVRRLRKLSGLEEGPTPATQAKIKADLQAVHDATKAALPKKGGYHQELKLRLIARDKQKIINLETRNRIWKQGKTL